MPEVTATDSPTALDAPDADVIRPKIPLRADIFVAYSTPPGFVAWRNQRDGSRFVQTFCEVVQANAKTEDINSLLTLTTERVALDYESNNPTRKDLHQKKQAPFTMSMLRNRFAFSEVTFVLHASQLTRNLLTLSWMKRQMLWMER